MFPERESPFSFRSAACTEYELLVVISNYGYNNLVMEAAREAGAGGGTVVHARGTGRERAEKFLGVTLAEEKEMTFIVTRTEKKNEIMKAIMEKAEALRREELYDFHETFRLLFEWCQNTLLKI